MSRGRPDEAELKKGKTHASDLHSQGGGAMGRDVGADAVMA